MRVKFWTGMAVSLGLLAFILSKMDFHRLWTVIRSADPALVLAATLLNLVFFVIRAVRWRYLIQPVKQGASLGSLFSATMIGFMANNVLPARLGEVVRAYAFGRRERVPKSSVFATIIVERLFDTMSVLLLLVIVLVYIPAGISGGPAAGAIRRTGTVSFGAYLAMVAVIALFIYRPGPVIRAVRAALSPISTRLAEGAAALTEKFAHGLGVVKEPRLLVMILFFSALHWAPLFLPIFILFKAFGLPYGVYASVFFLVLTCFSVAVPSTPGYVGTFEAAGAGALMLLGLDKETALGFTILAHAISYIPVTLIGFVCLYREGLSLGGIKRVEAEAEA